MANRVYRYPHDAAFRIEAIPEGVAVIDLGEHDGFRYLSVSEGFNLKTESSVVEGPLRLATDTRAELRQTLRDNLLAAREIDRDAVARIRERFSLDAELKALRTGDVAFNAFVEGIVAQAQERKVALGL